MKQLTRIFLSSILAGGVITLGCAANLMSSNKIAGSLFFTIGLFFICSFNWHLFTGRLPYSVTKSDWLSLPLIWVGNCIGSTLFGLLISFAKDSSGVVDIAKSLVETKMNTNLLEIFASAICCNFLIYLAVEGYKTCDTDLGKHLSLIFGVSVFVLCGFEHCIADVGYAVVAKEPEMVLVVLVATAGNLVGGRLIAGIHNLVKYRRIVTTKSI